VRWTAPRCSPRSRCRSSWLPTRIYPLSCRCYFRETRQAGGWGEGLAVLCELEEQGGRVTRLQVSHTPPSPPSPPPPTRACTGVAAFSKRLRRAAPWLGWDRYGRRRGGIGSLGRSAARSDARPAARRLPRPSPRRREALRAERGARAAARCAGRARPGSAFRVEFRPAAAGPPAAFRPCQRARRPGGENHERRSLRGSLREPGPGLTSSRRAAPAV
jgi:hypothetical protein